MEINKDLIVGKIQKLVDLNNGFHHFKTSFKLSSEKPFTMAVADMDGLEKAEYKQVEKEIDGEIEYTEEEEKDFYILLKAPEDTSVKVDIIINDLKNEVINKKEMENIEEQPQHTEIEDIFEADGHPKMVQPQQMPPQMQQQYMQPPLQEDEDDEVEESFFEKYKMYIIAITVFIIGYYIMTNPELLEKIKGMIGMKAVENVIPPKTPKADINLSAQLDGLDL